MKSIAGIAEAILFAALLAPAFADAKGSSSGGYSSSHSCSHSHGSGDKAVPGVRIQPVALTRRRQPR